jgi:hypothetical protein
VQTLKEKRGMFMKIVQFEVWRERRKRRRRIKVAEIGVIFLLLLAELFLVWNGDFMMHEAFERGNALYYTLILLSPFCPILMLFLFLRVFKQKERRLS